MLLAIRDRITGIVAWTIVVLISIPFMLWGVQEYFGMGEEQFAVKVNDREVSMREFDRAMAQSRQRLAQSFGGSIPDYFDADAFLREQTLTQLTNRELIVETLEADRYRVPAQLVGDRIMQDPRFQTDGQFNPEIYEADLRQQGVGKQEYEQQKMHELASRQFQRGVQNTAFVPRAELADYARLRYQTRGFEFVRLALSGFRGDLEPPDEEAIAAYYKDNKSEFQTEEKVRARYVELSLQDLADRVTVDEQTLRQQYEDAVANGRYRTDEVREARHILIEVPQDASEEQLEESRQQILELRKRIEQGAEFAEVAREHSDDTGSAEQGGSLGEVRSGDMVKPFEDVLFSLQPDELSEPVKTRFGFHLIKVDNIQPAETEQFDAVRDELAADYRRREAESIFFDRLDILANEAFENSGTLEPAAEAIGTEVRQSDFFTRRQPADAADTSCHPESC
jgi:peptidyl-prolyl cis-trans isomerase D